MKVKKYLWDAVRLVYRWFFRYPVIGGIAALLVWVVSFNGLSTIGLPDLFWQISAAKSFCAGLGIALVFSFVVFVGFLIDSEEFTADGHDLTWYAWRTYPLLVILFAAGVVRSRDGFWWQVVLGYVLGAIALRFIHEWLMRLATRFTPRVAVRRPVGPAIRGASPGNEPFHVYALLVAVILGVSYALFAIVPPFFAFISAPLAIAILLTISLIGYGWPYFRFPKQRLVIPFVVVVLIIAANAAVRYRYRYPNISYPPQRTAVDPLVSDSAALSSWLAHQQAGKPKLIVIATSGGGIRAAVWTSVVLHDLASLPDFMSHVRIITGASGGMVGAADVVASGGATSKLETEDSLDDVARSLVLRDVPKLVLPFAIPDRGVALERRWEELSPALKQPIGALAAHEADGTRPSLIFTPTIVENGRRLLISNLDLRALTFDQVGDETGRTSVQLFDILPSVRAQMHIATAARMSASFPYVSPASELPLEPRRHFVDAGYWDNYGVATATAWIRLHRQEIVDKNIDVALVQLRDTPERIHAGDGNHPATDVATVFFSELIGPIEGALGVIFTGSIYRNDHLIAQLEEIVPGHVSVFTFENGEDVQQPLSWALTKKQREKICKSLEGVAGERAKLAAWLSGQSDAIPH